MSSTKEHMPRRGRREGRGEGYGVETYRGSSSKRLISRECALSPEDEMGTSRKEEEERERER